MNKKYNNSKQKCYTSSTAAQTKMKKSTPVCKLEGISKEIAQNEAQKNRWKILQGNLINVGITVIMSNLLD